MKDFYHGTRWLKKREYILRRDGYRCQECKRYGRLTPATQVHHIQPLEENPELAYENTNLVSLCLACHNAKHPEKAGNRRGGVRMLRKGAGMSDF